MAEAVGGDGPWPREDIPDDDRLLYRVHKGDWDAEADEPNVGAFRGDSMSTNWAKYSDNRDTRRRCKSPQDNAVVSLPVGPIRSIAEQEVLHDPEVIAEPDPATPWYTSNRAHTLVIGAKKGPTDPEPRTRLLRMCRPAIKLAVPWEPDGE